MKKEEPGKLEQDLNSAKLQGCRITSTPRFPVIFLRLEFVEVVLFSEEAELFSARFMNRGSATSGERAHCVPVQVRVPILKPIAKRAHVRSVKRNKALENGTLISKFEVVRVLAERERNCPPGRQRQNRTPSPSALHRHLLLTNQDARAQRAYMCGVQCACSVGLLNGNQRPKWFPCDQLSFTVSLQATLLAVA